MVRLGQLLYRLVRAPNLLVVAVTQFLVCYHIIHPALSEQSIAPQLHLTKFIELCLVTVIITASGYIINDLQDEKIDSINRPGTNPVQELGKDFVLWLYGALVLGGFLISQLLAFRLGEREFLWLYPLATGILAIYSVYLKRKPLAGNLIVAFYCAGVIALVVGTERVALRELAVLDPASAAYTLNVCNLFMAIAVLATLLRELVKDLEDLKGDLAGGRKTIPALWGVDVGKYVALVLALAVAATLLLPIVLEWQGFTEPLVLGWVGVLLIALAFMMYQVFRAGRPEQYRLISGELKFFLFGGLVLLLLV